MPSERIAVLVYLSTVKLPYCGSDRNYYLVVSCDASMGARAVSIWLVALLPVKMDF